MVFRRFKIEDLNLIEIVINLIKRFFILGYN